MDQPLAVVAEEHRIPAEDSLEEGILAVDILVEDTPGMVREYPRLEPEHSPVHKLKELGPVHILSA